MNKKITVIILLVILAAAGTAVLVWEKGRKTEKVEQVIQDDGDKVIRVEKEKNLDDAQEKEKIDNELNQVIDLNSLPAEEVKFKESDYKGWKTYKNKEYGFEVKYPGNGWSYEDKNNSNPEGFGNKVIVLIRYSDPGEAYAWRVYFPLNKKQLTKKNIINALEERFGSSEPYVCKNVKFNDLKKVSFSGFDGLSFKISCTDIKSNLLFLFTDKGIFVLGGDNVISEGVDFQKFYSSFRLIN